jgi:hypothetical protein
MFGFANDGTSCFMDAVVIALFAPEYNQFFDLLLLSLEAEQHLQQGDGKESGWERGVSVAWRLDVQTYLRQYVTALRHTRTSNAPPVPSHLAEWRSLFRRVPTSENNFGDTRTHQSAVDFLRYLFAVFQVRDGLVDYQLSTTLLQKRPQVEAACALPEQSVSELVRLWMSAPVVSKYDKHNAHLCPDESERSALLSDVDENAFMLTNAKGDVRRVGAVECASIFLCHLTPEDANEQSVRIDRDLLPHIQVLTHQASYQGGVAVKITATRLVDAPVLIFEVSRKIIQMRGGSVQEFKLPTPVQFVDSGNTLRLHGMSFELRAVVCHEGDTESGHYTAYVWDEGGWWCYNDAAHVGKFMRAGDMELAARQSGELFFYVRV